MDIEQKFFNNNHLVAFLFKEGWIFTRILRGIRIDYKPYSQIGSVSATSTSGEIRLTDANGDDILYIDSVLPPRLIHCAIGFKPHFFKCYIKIPEDYGIMGVPPNILPPKPSDGDPQGSMDGIQSPYDAPTDYRELFIPPTIHITVNFYNPDSTAHEPLLNIKAKLYYLDILKPSIPAHRELIKAMVERKIDASFEVCGDPQNPMMFLDTYRDKWEVEPVSLKEVLKW